MKRTRRILVVALALGLAGAASAGSKSPTLSPGGRTLSGPGAVSVDAGGSQNVFSYSGGRGVCVTAANTGSLTVSVNVTGDTSPTLNVVAGTTESVCADGVTAIAVACDQVKGTCSAQWRVDLN